MANDGGDMGNRPLETRPADLFPADDRMWSRRIVEQALGGDPRYFRRFVGLVLLGLVVYWVVNSPGLFPG